MIMMNDNDDDYIIENEESGGYTDSNVYGWWYGMVWHQCSWIYLNYS